MTRIIVKNSAQAAQHFFSQTPEHRYSFVGMCAFTEIEAVFSARTVAAVVPGRGGNPVFLVPSERPSTGGRFLDCLRRENPHPVAHVPFDAFDAFGDDPALIVSTMAERFRCRLESAAAAARGPHADSRDYREFAGMLADAKRFSELVARLPFLEAFRSNDNGDKQC